MPEEAPVMSAMCPVPSRVLAMLSPCAGRLQRAALATPALARRVFGGATLGTTFRCGLPTRLVRGFTAVSERGLTVAGTACAGVALSTIVSTSATAGIGSFKSARIALCICSASSWTSGTARRHAIRPKRT